MAKKASWYQTGKEGVAKSKQEDEAAKQRREQQDGPSRFWLKNDDSAKLVFLDTPNFFFHEHNLKIDGKFGNFFTCIKEFDSCPIDDSGQNSSYCLAGSVIDTRTWEDRDGVKHKNTKRLLVAKGKARQVLLRRIESQKGNLKLAVMKFTRGSGNTECNTGEDIEFLGKLTVAKAKKLLPEGEKASEFFKPFDYEKLFAPKDKKTLAKLVGAPDPVGADDEDALLEDDLLGGGSDDEDILGDDEATEEETETSDDEEVVDSGDDDDVDIDELFS